MYRWIYYIINILMRVFNINPTIQIEKLKYYRIYINDLNKLRPFIKPYFIKEMLYKIN